MGQQVIALNFARFILLHLASACSGLEWAQLGLFTEKGPFVQGQQVGGHGYHFVHEKQNTTGKKYSAWEGAQGVSQGREPTCPAAGCCRTPACK